MSVKRVVTKFATLPGVASALGPLMRDRATIFMLHRFKDEATGVKGQDINVVRRGLAYLRKHRYNLVHLSEVISRSLEGPLPSKTVAFTIDDGYWDHAQLAAPAFAEYDCPVTTFITTGFIDRQIWFWWDKIEFIFEHSRREQVSVNLAGTSLNYSMKGPGAQRARADFTERCKRVPDAEKHRAIAEMAAAGEVDLPASAPGRYQPMTWDRARAIEQGGMRFGPHTVTHPILTQTGDAQSEQEISRSWKRLREELKYPVPVFCYPNGGREDFGAREIETLRKNDLLGAVVGIPGYLKASTMTHANARFEIQRFGFPNDIANLVQCTSGMERLKAALRGQPL